MSHQWASRVLTVDESGATAVEFAIIVPVLLLFILGFTEASRLLWVNQTIHGVAVVSARCAAVGREGCASSAQTMAFARSRALALGVDLSKATIVVAQDQVCHQTAHMQTVRIEQPFVAFVPFLDAAFPASLEASACYPMVVDLS
jgi:hypothetical protein